MSTLFLYIRSVVLVSNSSLHRRVSHLSTTWFNPILVIFPSISKLSPISLIYSLTWLIHPHGLISPLILPNIALVLNIYCTNPSLIFLSLPSTVDAPISPYSVTTGVYVGAPSICLYTLQFPLLTTPDNHRTSIQNPRLHNTVPVYFPYQNPITWPIYHRKFHVRI